MAKGDAINGIQTIAGGATINIRPSSGEEWSVHNIYYNAGLEIYMTNGTTDVFWSRDENNGAILGASFRLTNAYYIKIKNASSSSTCVVAFDGIQTK